MPERYTLKSIFRAIIANFDIDKGFIKTFRLLTMQPGKSIRTYLLRDRSLLTKPFKLLIVTSAVAAFLTLQLSDENPLVKGFNEGAGMSKKEKTEEINKPIEKNTEVARTEEGQPGQNPKPEEEKLKKLKKKEAVMGKIGDMFKQYFNLFIILAIPFMALASFWFFKKSGFNYAEHIVFNSYVLSYQNLLYLLLAPLIYLVSMQFNWLYFALSYCFFAYACTRFFETKPGAGIAKSIAAAIVGTLLYMVSFTVIMVVVIVVLITSGG